MRKNGDLSDSEHSMADPLAQSPANEWCYHVNMDQHQMATSKNKKRIRVKEY